MIQLRSSSYTHADSPVDLMSLLPRPQGNGNRSSAVFVVDVAGVPCAIAAAESGDVGQPLKIGQYECGPYDYPGATAWLIIPGGGSCIVTPARGVMP